MNAQTSGQFFISIRLTTQFGITLEINLLLFSCVWNKGAGFYYFLDFMVVVIGWGALRKDFGQDDQDKRCLPRRARRRCAPLRGIFY